MNQFSKLWLKQCLGWYWIITTMRATARNGSGDEAECPSDCRSCTPKYQRDNVVSKCYSPDGERKLCISQTSPPPLVFQESHFSIVRWDVVLGIHLHPKCPAVVGLAGLMPPQVLWMKQLLIAPVQCNCSLLTNGHQHEVLSSRC